MHIIDPSFRVLDDLDQASLPVRIEYCGRICYKSEHRIDPQSAIPFVRKMAEHGHNSVLEMGVLTLRVDCGPEAVSALFFCQPRFLQIDRPAADRLLVSGSVRAFREMLSEHPDDPISRAIARFLARRHPYFFEGLPVDADAPAADGITVAKVPLAEVERFPVDRLARHRHLAVKFIVNRAVTHELVRHRPCTFLQ